MDADAPAAPADPGSGDDTPVVTDQPDKSRYELRVGGELAGFLVYRLSGQQISLVHTEIDPGFQGAGLAAHLARFSLDDARKRNLAVLPTCPYVRRWISRHPDYMDLVPEERRGGFGA